MIMVVPHRGKGAGLAGTQLLFTCAVLETPAIQFMSELGFAAEVTGVIRLVSQ